MASVKTVSSFAWKNRLPVFQTVPRLQASRATVPPPVEGYFHRSRLLDRCRPLDRRLTVLQAPCGFGKTALLNDICHRERDRGTLVAWLRVDEKITGDLLLNYLAYAFARGGLDLSVLRQLWTEGWRSQLTSYRVGLLMRAIENYRKPCLLALDEVERLAVPDASATVDFLLHRSPPNLHFAMTMRSNPRGLDLATDVLDGQGTILTAEDLRFTNPEIALFLGSPLSREQLVAAAERTAGWPAALRLHRNLEGIEKHSSASDTLPGYKAVVADFLGSRLMRGLGRDSREFLLDVALFDTIDPSLMDDVFPGEHLTCRTELLSKLGGLVRPIDPSGQVLRLHPVVREYCSARRLREDAGRFRQLQSRLARATARRGQLNDALRHAATSGDDALCGKILEDEGGASLLFRDGAEPFLTADGYLNPQIVEAVPRLALMRCIVLVLNGQADTARALYERVRNDTREFQLYGDDGNRRTLRVDRIIAQSMLLAFTCQSMGDTRLSQVLEEAAPLAADEGLAPTLRGSLYTIVCFSDCQRARFQLSRQWGTKARDCFTLADSAHGRGLIDIHDGIVAMAQGRVEDAIRAYTRHQSIRFSGILLAELQIERNRKGPEWSRRPEAGDLWDMQGWFDVHAAAHGNRVEVAFENGGIEAALDLLEDSLDRAAHRDLACLVRLLSAQRVSYLVAAGKVDVARRAWEVAGLPEHLVDQLDLDGQTWREMEAIACARIGLLRAEGEFETARRLACSLRDCAEARGLTRTLMRCLAEWMSLEFQAARMDEAVAQLHEFLRRFRSTDYARPLARHRQVSVRVLRRLLDREMESDIRRHAESLLDDLVGTRAGEQRAAPRYSAREISVLEGLAMGQRDKQIARCLGLTENGVRYHLKKIYRKMGASGRVDAARRASSRSII